MWRSRAARRAIENAHALLARCAPGRSRVPEMSLAQIDEQLALAVDRVMTEGSLYDRELAALAIKQARGDLIEAIFLFRAYRTTLPRFGASEPLDTARMACGGASPRPSRTCRAARSSGRPSTTPTACSTPLAADGARAPPAPAEHRADAKHRCRASPTCSTGEGLIERLPAGRGADGRRPHPRAADLSRRPRPAPAEPRPWRRRLPAGARLFDPARLRQQPSVRRRDPLRRRGGRVRARGAGLCRRSARSRSPSARWSISSRARDDAAAIHPRLRAGFGQASARRWRWRWSTARCAPELGEEVKAPAQDEEFVLSQRQRRGVRLRAAPEAAALRRLPVRARAGAAAAREFAPPTPT